MDVLEDLVLGKLDGGLPVLDDELGLVHRVALPDHLATERDRHPLDEHRQRLPQRQLPSEIPPPGHGRVFVERTQQLRLRQDRNTLGRARAAAAADQVDAVGDTGMAPRVLYVLRDNLGAVVNAYPAAADHHPYPLADHPPRHRVGVGVDHHRAVGMDRPSQVPVAAAGWRATDR